MNEFVITELIAPEALKRLLDAHAGLVGLAVGVIAPDGKLLGCSGPASVCAQFHRLHPLTAAHCRHMPTGAAPPPAATLSPGVLCDNGLRDAAFPITVRDTRVATLIAGPFLLLDDTVHLEMFRKRSRACGFPEESYMRAIEATPRLSTEQLRHLCVSTAIIAELLAEMARNALLEKEQANRQADNLRTLSRNETITRALLESNADLVACFRADGVCTFVNKAYASLAMCDTAALLDRHFLAPVPEAQRPEAEQALQAMRPHMPPTILDLPCCRPDGSIAWARWFIFPVATADGSLVEYEALGHDITAQRRAEQALRASEEKYRALVENSEDIVMRFDRAGRHLYVSPSVVKVVPFLKPDEFIGKTHRELGFPEAMCEFWESRIRQVIDSEQPHETEFRAMLGTEERVFNWRLFPELDSDRRVTSVLSVSRDITAHRRSEHDYRQLFSSMSEGCALHEIICDAAGTPVDYRFLAVNPAFEHLTGLKAEAVVGHRIREIMPATENQWIQVYGRVALTGERATFEQFAKELGKHFRVTAFRPAPGQFACIFDDITTSKQFQAEREALLRNLENTAAEMEQVLYTTSHDLRTPLINMVGFAQRLEKHCADIRTRLAHGDVPPAVRDDLKEVFTARIPKALHFIAASGHKMDALINGLLRLSRTGRVELRLVRVDMNALIGTVLKIFAIPTEKVRAAITVHPLPACRGDAIQLNQLFSNLVDNALKYHAPGQVPEIVISGTERNGEAIYCVADCGPGIEARLLADVWLPFRRLDPNGPVSGEGLGLALVRRIAARHGGRTWAASEPGAGTRVYVALPLDGA